MNNPMTIEQVEREMQGNRTRLVRDSAEIEQDKHLSNEGKLAKLAELKTITSSKHEALKKAHGAAIKAEQERKYDRVFKSGAGSIDSYRPVYAMARAANHAELVRLKEQAQNTGDKMLLQAVYHAAYDGNNLGLLDDAPDPIQDLIEFEYESGIRKGRNSSEMTKQFLARTRLSAPQVR